MLVVFLKVGVHFIDRNRPQAMSKSDTLHSILLCVLAVDLNVTLISVDLRTPKTAFYPTIYRIMKEI